MTASQLRRALLGASVTSFGIFTLSVLSRRFFGDAEIVRALTPSSPVEFLILFFCAITFVAAALTDEHQAGSEGAAILEREERQNER